MHNWDVIVKCPPWLQSTWFDGGGWWNDEAVGNLVHQPPSLHLVHQPTHLLLDGHWTRYCAMCINHLLFFLMNKRDKPLALFVQPLRSLFANARTRCTRRCYQIGCKQYFPCCVSKKVIIINTSHEDWGGGGCLAEDENEMVVLSAGRERMGRLGGEAVTQMRQTTTFHLDHHDDDSHSAAETSSLETKDTPSPANCMSFLFFFFTNL